MRHFPSCDLELEDPRTRERNVIPPRQFPALFRFCSSQCPVLSAQRRVPIDWRPVLEEGNLNSEVPPTTPQNLERGHSLKKGSFGAGGLGGQCGGGKLLKLNSGTPNVYGAGIDDP